MLINKHASSVDMLAQWHYVYEMWDMHGKRNTTKQHLLLGLVTIMIPEIDSKSNIDFSKCQ